MRVTIPFAYTAKFQAPISKRMEDVVKTEMISHDIPEISSAETTQVATWQHRDPYMTGPRRIECRTYAGYYLYSLSDGRPASTDQVLHGLTAAEANAGMAWYYVARHAWFYDGNRQQACRNALQGKSSSARTKSAIELGSDRDIELDKATKGLADLVVIDDAIWCRAQPPRLVLSVRNSEGAKNGVIGVAATPLPGSPSGFNHPMRHDYADDRYEFELTATDQAEEFADRLGIACDKSVSDLSFRENIDKGLHHETWLTLCRATQVMESIGRTLGNLPPDVVTRWLDLRSVACRSNGRMADAIERKLHDLNSALGQHGYADPKLSAYFTEIQAMRPLTPQVFLPQRPGHG